MSAVRLVIGLSAWMLLFHPAAASVAAGEIERLLASADTEGQIDDAHALRVAGEQLHSVAPVLAFYRGNGYQPVWTAAGRRSELISEIRAAADHGLLPERYHLKALTAPATEGTAREVLATDAFLTQARHRALGAVSPEGLDQDWYLPRDELPAVDVLNGALEAETVGASLAGLWPQHAEYRALVTERRRLTEPAADPPIVPPGPLLKYGQSGSRVLALKERLLGPGRHTPLFDERLLEAVIDFQASVGLNTDGMAGDATLELLNASRAFWLDTLDANLERWRWLPEALPPSYLLINIAAFELRVIDQGWEMLRMKVIVGQPARRTPTFTQSLKYLVYNPIWTVPFELAVKDKLPALKHDPVGLALLGYEARRADSEDWVPVDTIDWRRVRRETFHYDLRQLPGPSNALGRIKFMLPNRFAVYLHDTPDQGLFEREERDFSSGCIRLANPFGLADWVLRHDGQAETAARMREQLASWETREVRLRTPLPVLVVYFTAFTDEIGAVQFRRDHYQRDRAIIDALHAG